MIAMEVFLKTLMMSSIYYYYRFLHPLTKVILYLLHIFKNYWKVFTGQSGNKSDRYLMNHYMIPY